MGHEVCTDCLNEIEWLLAQAAIEEANGRPETARSLEEIAVSVARNDAKTHATGEIPSPPNFSVAWQPAGNTTQDARSLREIIAQVATKNPA